jgi:general stress protein 26
MPTPRELEEQFWRALKSDMTVMLGLVGVNESHARPLTAHLTGERGPIWFFTAKDAAIAQNLTFENRAVGTFADKGHKLFASLHGRLALEHDRTILDQLWNPYVAAWFEKGKDDPKLALLRFDAERAEIWENESSFLAGMKLIFGVDPKGAYRDKVAEVSL